MADGWKDGQMGRRMDCRWVDEWIDCRWWIGEGMGG